MCVAGDELRRSGSIGSNVRHVCCSRRAALRARLEDMADMLLRDLGVTRWVVKAQRDQQVETGREI